MSAEIISEIRLQLNSFNDKRLSFKSAHLYEGNSLTVTFLKFMSDEGPISVISLELRDPAGHSAKQDLLMETEGLFKSKILNEEFRDNLVKRLRTLNEALKEMN